MKIPKHWRLRLLNVYPPYLGAGIRVRREGTGYQIRMKLRWWNRNYFGTHFGGSLYSMCDPFYVLILAEQLGRDYIVWDKAASIRFRRPGKGEMRADFQMSDEEIARVKGLADAGEVVEPTYSVEVVDEAGKVVAEVEKLCYVRRK